MKFHGTNACWLVVLLLSFKLPAQTPGHVQYDEYPNPKVSDTRSWQVARAGVSLSFASADLRHEKEKAPVLSETKSWNFRAWRAEKVHTKLLVWTTVPVQKLGFETSDLKSLKGDIIPRKNITARFMRYVVTDSLSRKGMGCGIEPDLDSSLVEDVIDDVKNLSLAPNTTQPAWLSIYIPRNTPAGKYKGSIKVTGVSASQPSLTFEIEVLNRTLPEPGDWKFHLDLWQNPFSIARFHHVQDWSPEHMEAMAPYMKMLADAGQKVITTSIIHDPWNSQTFDVYKSMVKWVKKADGSWVYDYTIFDKWVSFMMSMGINREIGCYSLIPWNLKFYYYDEALGKDTNIVASPGSLEYERHWKPMLSDFARHLKTKGWFGITAIAMDERPMKHMQIALAIIKSADKDFKISMAGEYHREIEKDLSDYSVASKFILAKETLDRRTKDGFITTYYTACPEAFPNTFTFSPPAEVAFLGWYAAAKGFDGYLRWAFNSWPGNPLQDSRFGVWSAGDTYFIYPGVRSSIRFERLIEGIQAFEKTRILKDEFTRNKQWPKLKALEVLLEQFEIANIPKHGAATIVSKATTAINAF